MVRNVLYTIICASKNDMSLHLLYDSLNPKCVFFYYILYVVVYNHDLIKVIVVVVDSVNFMCDIMKSCVLCIQE